jgi:5-methylcytosine-specific restriction endonuclease McrA
LESHRRSPDGFMALVFSSPEGDGPMRCQVEMARACPYREWDPGPPTTMVSCPCCGRRHRQGSVSQQLCEAWFSAKAELRRMRSLPEGRRFFPEGTRELPYSEHTTALVRRLAWDRMKAAVLRRDRYRCQDCGTDFDGRRRRVWDSSLHRGRGGHRWESLEVHHIIPRAEGGGDHPGNLKTLCPACHTSYTREHSAARAVYRRERAAALRELGNDEFIDDPRD